jgi:zinc transporter ZupT
VYNCLCYSGFGVCKPLLAVSGAFLIPLLVTLVAVAGVAVGVYLTGLARWSRSAVPFSGGVLVGVALFFVVPEMANVFSWPGALAWATAGFLLLWTVDRYLYTVCPSCSHSHDHDSCATRLHGFAGPLLTAAALHSILDGWTLAASQETHTLGAALMFGIAVHKLPEGIALGVIVRAATPSRSYALVGCSLAEAATLIGAALEIILYRYVGLTWIYGLLALAAGSFLYLGYHAIHAEYKRRGVLPAFLPAFTGVAGSSVIRLFGGFHSHF